MLKRIIASSIKGRIVVLALCAFLLFYGVGILKDAPLDVFPEFAPAKIEVQTEAPGLSTEEVESLITTPLENALNGTPGLMTLRSKSVMGLSSVVLLLKEGVNLQEARQNVQERVTLEASRLPSVARPPIILQPLSSLSRIMKIGLSSTTLSQIDLTQLTLWTIRPKLMSISGVANVAIWGQRDKQFQILVDPNRLRAQGITLEQLMRAAGDATVLDTGGFVEMPNQRLVVRHHSGVFTTENLANTVVTFRGDAPIRIRDVAKVVIDSPPPIGNAIINGGPGLLLVVEKQLGGNTLEISRQIDQAMKELQPALKGVQVDTTLFRPATFIETALHNLTKALILGCILVIIILVIFLNNLRTAFISLTAIPLSLITAVIILISLGITLNTMVIAGLVIALGEVVDDAIIDVENIVRRLRLNREAGNPISAFKVVVQASLEVRSAVVYASMIVIVIFLPIFFLHGVAAAFFQPLALAYILAIIASLLVALIVTPALSYMMLTRNNKHKPQLKFIHSLRQRYANFLPRILNKPKEVVRIILAIFICSFAASFFYGHEFLPEFQETDMLMHFLGKPGTSIEEMSRITTKASHELLAIPGVRNFGAHIGRAEVADEVYGPEFTELWISIDPKAPYEKTRQRVQEVMDKYPGIYTDVQTYLKERSKEVLSGAGSSIVVRLYGPDLNVLRSEAAEIKKVMAKVAGISDLKIEPQVLVPQIEIALRPEATERYGLTPGLIRRATTTLLRGSKVGEIYEGQMRFDVMVVGVTDIRTDVAALQALPIDTPTGMQVRLRDVAEVKVVGMPNAIKRESGSRRIDVTANAKGRDTGSVAADIEKNVRALKFAPGYYPVFLGEHQAQRDASNRLLSFGFLALLVILFIIYSDFKSWRLTLLVACTLPFALVGGGIAVFLTGGIISLGSTVGFITVIGIAARNGIMLISHYHYLEREENEVFGPALVQRASQERLIPILMTACATALALLPLIVNGTQPGYEVEYPLAVVILGGLITSTILNLFFVPVLYLRYGKSKNMST